jgi:hypothetical protein
MDVASPPYQAISGPTRRSISSVERERAAFGLGTITINRSTPYRNIEVGVLVSDRGYALAFERQWENLVPWDDVDVIYMLKRGLLRKRGKLPGITVVEHATRPVRIEQHEAGQRYRAVFGRNIDWQPIGFERWVRQVAAS